MESDDLERHRWERLLRWLDEEHGMDVGEDAFHVEAREVPGAGRGLFAARHCPPSTTLFKIPATALMNRATIIKLYPQLRGQAMSGVQLVSLHLFLHRPVDNADSQDPTFGPYISTLPRDFSAHPLTWMVKRKLNQYDTWDEQILDLLPPSTSRKLSAIHDRFWADWRAIVRILTEHPTIVAQSSRINLASTLQAQEQDNSLPVDYLWAWLNVNTRCIFYRIRSTLSDLDNFTLCPVLDFANHSNGPTQIFPVVDSEAWAVVTKKYPKYFLFFGPSRDAVSSGQELYLQYGKHSNSFLLTEYGFVNQVADGVIRSGAYAGEVDVQELVEELFAQNTSLGSRLRVVLEEEGYWGDWTIHSSPIPAHPSYRLMTALHLLCLFDHVTIPQAETSHLDASVNQWRDVILGRAEEPPEIGERWRRSLERLCGHIVERARCRLTGLAATPSHQSNDHGWRDWMVGNVRLLWTEELEVAEAVLASLSTEVEF
ncbi:SET domain-containing protein [Daedaleopsis nitida]|nr:SET domain-containing protein [Daedaleopsis nitida]